MNYIEQIRLAVEASGKVVWSVLLACIAVVVVELQFPDFFQGLPTWVIPFVRIVGIFFAVLALFSVVLWMTRIISRILGGLCLPLKRRGTQRKLLELSVGEVLILSMAVAKADRTVWVKPDVIEVISLQDKGLLKRYVLGVVTSDGTSSFNIPNDVWRVIHTMEEFRLDDANLLRLGDIRSFTEAQFVAALPSRHPIVKTHIENGMSDKP